MLGIGRSGVYSCHPRKNASALSQYARKLALPDGPVFAHVKILDINCPRANG